MIKIKNWSEFQHFKDRNPPWIKLYKTILERRDIAATSDRNFRVLVGLWLLASEDKTQEGILPDIPEIAFRLRFSEDEIAESLQILNEFLIHDDKLKISSSYQDDAPETETETETETEKPIAHPEPDAPNSREEFEDIWQRYPQKLGKEKAFLKYKKQVLTEQDWIDIQTALVNYIAEVEVTRRNGQPDLQWQYGSTWFNNNWRDYVDYTPPKKVTPGQRYDGVLPQNEPTDRLDHNDLINKIGEQIVYVEETMADDAWAGAPAGLHWLNSTVGHLILEYSERFPKGPHIAKYTAWLDQHSEKVMNVMDST